MHLLPKKEKRKKKKDLIYLLCPQRQANEKRDFPGRWNEVKKLTHKCNWQDLSKIMESVRGSGRKRI